MKNILLLLIVILALYTSCKQEEEILSNSIREIEERHVPDNRLVHWEIELKRVDRRFLIIGETSSEFAFSDLKNIVLNEFPNVKFNVELLPSKKLADKTQGLVSLSVCNLRKQGSHSAELVSQALLGTPIKVFKEQHGWYLVQTPDRYFGWVNKESISLKTKLEMKEWAKHEKVIFNEQFGFAFVNADVSGPIHSDLVLANILSVTNSTKGFYEVLIPDGKSAFVEKSKCKKLKDWLNTDSLDCEAVVATALNFKGIPYLWGGASSKMTDCSGFTKTIYYIHGIVLQRDASQQAMNGELIETDEGYKNLKKGDLLFFGKKATNSSPEHVTHVGLYIGDTEFIHASGKVRISSLDSLRDNYDPQYEQSFVRARRVTGQVGTNGIEWVRNNGFYKEILAE